MIKIGDAIRPSVIELDDPTLENAEILTAFFDTIVFNQPLLGFGYQKHNPVIRFMQKYDCERELYHIRSSIHLAISENRSHWQAFAAAAQMNDIKLSGRVIAEAGHWSWKASEGEEQFGINLQGGNLFDIRAVPFESMQCVPPAVLWALLSASTKRTGLKENVIQDNKAMSVEVMRLMRLKGE